MIGIIIPRLIIFIVLTSFSISVTLAKDSLSEVPKNYLENDLKRFSAKGLDRFIKDKKAREYYSKEVYLNYEIEKKIEKLQLGENEIIIMQLHQMRIKILTDALVKHTLEEKQLDLLALAKERYELNKDQHRTRRKIKLSQIFIAKIPGHEEKAKKKIGIVFGKLEAGGNTSFEALAKEFSEDRRAKNGGLLKKWILEPDFKKGNVTPPIQAVFSLEKIGEISPIIETHIGFHIMKLMADTPSVALGFDEVKMNIVDDLKKELWLSEKDKLLKKMAMAPSSTRDDSKLLGIIQDTLKKRIE
jgi:parvulin-like peptidyl-prolyl isomerase